MNSEHLCRVESVRARRRYACADRALTVLHEAKEAGEMAAACLRLKLPREHKGAKATFRYERDSILATACAQTGLPEHESHRYIRLPIVLTLHAGLPRAQLLARQGRNYVRWSYRKFDGANQRVLVSGYRQFCYAG
jgi:hypothetical protein